MDLDTYEISRQVNTMWELFGEIGGLVEVATILVSAIMSVKIALLGSGLDHYLISNLFFILRKS